MPGATPDPAGWAALAAGVLTVAGLVTLLAFFATGRRRLGDLNDVCSLGLVVATVPVALALHRPASAAGPVPATLAVAADVVGAALSALATATLLARRASFERTLLPISIGNALVGGWLLATAALLLAAGAVPVPLGILGVAGGGGLAVTSIAFLALGRDHPVTALAGLASVVGLTGFFAWAGLLLLAA